MKGYNPCLLPGRVTRPQNPSFPSVQSSTLQQASLMNCEKLACKSFIKKHSLQWPQGPSEVPTVG